MCPVLAWQQEMGCLLVRGCAPGRKAVSRPLTPVFYYFMNCTQRDIKNQYARLGKDGWLGWFQSQAERVGATTALLLAIGSRETNLKSIRGDFRGGQYHGFGVMQVDIGTDADFARHWTPALVEPGIRRGAEIWRDKLAQVVSGEGKTIRFKGREFTGRVAAPDDERRIATAGYNCGLWAYYHFSRQRHVDSTTTGRDYSRDVYDRAIEFAALLEADGIEPCAVKAEIEAQGKYARNAHRERFAVAGKAARRQADFDAPCESDEALITADYHAAAPEPLITPEVEAVAPAAQLTPVTGGGPDDAAVQVTQPFWARLWALGGSGLGALGAAKGLLSDDKTLLIIGIAGAVVLLLALMFRGVILDWARLKIHADTGKQNVR